MKLRMKRRRLRLTAIKLLCALMAGNLAKYWEEQENSGEEGPVDLAVRLAIALEEKLDKELASWS